MNKPENAKEQAVTLPWEAAFAKSMARARVDASMSQTELARRATEAGLPLFQQQIQRIENLTRPVRLNEAVLLARILHGDPWDMAAQMVDDATAWDLLVTAQKAAEEAALRTVRAAMTEYYRFNAAVHDARLRLEQFDRYQQARGREKFDRQSLEAFRSNHARLERTMELLGDALEQLTDEDDKPQLMDTPEDAKEA
jgi:hypothetical protein